jgi:hypothetical protein
MPDYKFDVFVSVKNDEVFGQWLRDHFLPLFESYLKNDVIVECHRPIKGIFYYKKSLQPGDPWPDELREAIRESRVAVALCSPEYFYSKWCLTEFHSFLERGRNANAKVVIPASVHDGEAFPEEARNIQAADFSSYVIVGPGFAETKRYTEFQEHLKEFSKRVAKLVHDAPNFAAWPVVEKSVPGEEPEIQQQVLKK